MDAPRLPRTAEIADAFSDGAPIAVALAVHPSSGHPQRVPLPTAGHVVLGGAWAAQADITIADPTVSARHARIEVDQGRARIVDLRSRNGTWVGGVRVEAAALTVGACAIVGRSAISIESAIAHVPLGDDGDCEPLPGAIGRSTAMRRLGATVRSFAALSAPVLVRGESGSGKEVVARALHALSPRRKGPFHAVNLGALPRELAEGELFGHERGAFTGAIATRAGVFELADRGTLLLDELGELPIDMQPKLLRVLETGEVRRIGGRGARTVDVRVVAATWCPLEQRILDGTFREDLFHRVAVLVIDVPPLRDRRVDIPAIVDHFLTRNRSELGVTTISPGAASRLSAEAWPGNVRELRNVVYRAAAIAVGEGRAILDAPDVARALSTRAGSPPPLRPTRDPRNAAEIVRAHGGNVTAAARACGVPRETLRDWLRARRTPP